MVTKKSARTLAYTVDNKITSFVPSLFNPALGADPCNGVLQPPGSNWCKQAGAKGGTDGPNNSLMKQDLLLACIRERADRLKLPVDLPQIADRATLERTLVAFGTQLLREVSDPAVVTVFRLAISEAVRAPEVAQTLNDVAIAASRIALREIMRHAIDARLLGGGAPEMAEHFFGLLWGSRMLGLLLGIAERPSAREIAARAERAAAAFLLVYPV